MDFGKLTEEQKDTARMIADEARDQGIDPELALAVAWAESNFNPYAIGPKVKGGHAIGPMQVHETNAPGLGIQPHDLHDPKTNVRAGVRILKDNLRMFNGNKQAALAAYNSNPTYAKDFVQSGGQMTLLPSETQNYLKKINKFHDLGMSSGEEDSSNPFGKVPKYDLKQLDPTQAEDQTGQALPTDAQGEEVAPSDNSFGTLPSYDIEDLQKPLPGPPKTEAQKLQDAGTSYLEKGYRAVQENPDKAVAGAGGAYAGYKLGSMGSDKIADMEKRVVDARQAFQVAKSQAPNSKELLARQTQLAKLEAELTKAHEAAAALRTPEPAAKGNANFNYAKAFGATDIDAARAVDMSKQPGGAWDQMAKGRSQEAKVQGLMPGAKPVGPQNIYLSPQEAEVQGAKLTNAQSLADQKVAALKAEADAARSEVENARKLRESAEKAKQAMGAVEKSSPTGNMLGKAGVLGQKLAGKTIGAVGGAGAGLSAYEALDRYTKGDTSGAVMAGIDALLNGMSMLPPTTPVTAALKAIGITGSLASAAISLYNRRNPSKATPKSQITRPANTPNVNYLPKGGRSKIVKDEYGRYHLV